MLSANIIKYIKKFIPVFDKKAGIYEYGEGNYYPETTNYLVENSVTAYACYSLLTNFIVGKGWGENNTKKVNKKDTLLDFTQQNGRSLSKNRGAFIHFNYDYEGKKTEAKVLPFQHCRVGKKDDNKYNGKIIVCENWQDNKAKRIAIDVYNPKLAKHQFETQGAKYQGQILFVNMDDHKYYPNSSVHSVINDCASEIEASKYKLSSLETGFFGKTLFITKPFIGIDIPQDSDDYRKLSNERTDFRSTIQEFIGGDSKRALHLEMEYDTIEDIDKQILIKDISSNIDDKVFEYTESSVSNNIRIAFDNIPALLVRNQDSQMFGNSGEAIKEAKIFYQDNTTEKRMIMVESTKEAMRGLIEDDLVHEELITKEIKTNENTN